MKRPVQVDVARLAGVSRATVSYVLNGQKDSYVNITEETRQRVVKAAEALGYQPHAMAQSLRSGMTNILGLLIPDMHNPHYWQIANGVEQEAHVHGHDMLLMNAALNPARELRAVKTLARRRVDGLILLLTYLDESHDEIEQLVRERMPLVIVGNYIKNVDSIRPAFEVGALDAIKHLISLGHRRIGLIYGVAPTALGKERLDAYYGGLRDAHLPIDEQLIETCGTSLEEGYRAASRLLDHESPPTALVVINDMIAIGALRSVLDHRLRVPDDFSIVSFDDIDIASYLNPPLTTVHIDSEALGRAAVRLILQRWEQPDLEAQEIVLTCNLVVRGSSGPAPAYSIKPEIVNDSR